MRTQTTTFKRSTVTLIAIAVLAALLPACGGKGAPIAVPAGAQAEDLVGLEPCTYEANKKKYDAECGTLVVPENRGNPASRLIALPVIRVRALSDSPAEPIFYLSGGPGQSNLHFRYLEDKDFGHTGSFWNSQPEARVHLLNTFFDTGQVDASLYTYQPLDFDVGLGWPGLAKLLVAVPVLIVVLVVAAVWVIIDRQCRRRG